MNEQTSLHQHEFSRRGVDHELSPTGESNSRATLTIPFCALDAVQLGSVQGNREVDFLRQRVHKRMRQLVGQRVEVLDDLW